MSTFTAQYRTRCPDCSEMVEPEDEAVFVAGLVVHATCQPSALRAEAALTKAPCSSCFMVPSVSGACGCD